MMKKLRIEKADSNICKSWNEFVESSNEGTIFHRLDFLSYHGNKYADVEHQLVVLKDDDLFGVMPLTIVEEDGKRRARSPYGGSYGGPCFSKPLSYSDSISFISVFNEYMKSEQVGDVEVTLPIQACYRKYSDTLRFAMIENGYKCVNRDVSSIVYLGEDADLSNMVDKKMRDVSRYIKKAKNSGVNIIRGAREREFLEVVNCTHNSLNAKPTHTYDEWKMLQNMFKDRIYADVAYLNGRPIAGIGFIVINKMVTCSFYLCSDPQYRDLNSLFLLLYEAIERLKRAGTIWLDMGTSSVGQRARGNIFRFKENFGSIGMFRETYIYRSE
jgi:hypothetical protein